MSKPPSPRASSKPGSDRSFGRLFATVFGIIALWPLIGGGALRSWALVVAGAFLVVALVRPALLAPLNRAWMAFANLLHSVMTPVVMAVLFYIAVTPMALVMRVFGKRPIPVRFDRRATSYWIARQPPGPAPDSMKNQF